MCLCSSLWLSVRCLSTPRSSLLKSRPSEISHPLAIAFLLTLASKLTLGQPLMRVLAVKTAATLMKAALMKAALMKAATTVQTKRKTKLIPKRVFIVQTRQLTLSEH